MYTKRWSTCLTAAVLFLAPTAADAQQQALQTSVVRLRDLVVSWIVLIGWAAIAVYIAVLAFQWSMGDPRAAQNWWKPVMGAVLLGSVTWLSGQFASAVGS